MMQANDIPRWKRVFTPANVVSVAAGITVFVLGRVVWDTNTGALVSAVVAALATGMVWLIWWTFTRVPALETILDTERLGTIPDDGSGPAPTLLDPGSETSAAYRDAVNRLEGATRGHVLLVSSPGPGQGATTVALNLAVAATQEGRRVLLVDGDASGRGLSKFMGTGAEPGLTDLAAGDATLADATRLWKFGENDALPVLPAGSQVGEDAALAGDTLSKAIEGVAGRADLVLIDAPPILWSDMAGKLAQLADGTVLVVAESAGGKIVEEANERFSAVGAPVLGYVVNRAAEPSFWQQPIVRMAKRSLAAFALIALLFAAYTGGDLWNSWRGVERQEFDVAAAEEALPVTTAPPQPDVLVDDVDDIALEEIVTAEEAPDSAYRSFLLVGGDKAAGAADVIMLLVLPTDGTEPFMVSLPRDLYLPNRCTGDYSRINVTIHGCTAVNGPTLLSMTVEDFTGISVDHFALFDFDGFEAIIDSVGGVEICVDYAVRDEKAHLDLPAGCTNASGEQALAWVRSRKTQQLVNGRWRSVPGASDLSRNQHQQDVIIELFGKLKTFDSPSDLTQKVSGLAKAFTLDDRLSLPDAIALGWQIRDVSLDSINRLEIDVKLARTKEGRSVLIPTISFDELLAEEYPHLLEALDARPDVGRRASP